MLCDPLLSQVMKLILTLLLAVITTTLSLAHEFEVSVSHRGNRDQSRLKTVSIRVDNDHLGCDLSIKNSRGRVLLQKKNINLIKNKANRFHNVRTSSNSNLKAKVSNCNFVRPITPITPTRIKSQEIDEIISRSIDFLDKTQIKETIGQSRFKGEWGSIMEARKGIAIMPLKRGYKEWDSNCFTTSSTFISLAELYLNHQPTQKLKDMLQLALTDVMACEEGGTFNFWHKITLPEHLHKNGKINETRGPNNFDLKKRFFYMFSNIINDSDDTSIAYTAIHMAKKIQAREADFIAPEFPLQSFGGEVEKYRDVDRFVFHPYDRLAFRQVNTGAFLTWLSLDEKKTPRGPSNKKATMPFQVNDVDCVVNSNILSGLAALDELETTDGVTETCAYLNESIRKRKRVKCSLYYPNKYAFPYALSKAFHSGVKCLKDSSKFTLDTIISEQENDGSWDAFKEHDDIIQSTVFALHTLLNYDDKSEKAKMAIQRAVDFLLKNKREDQRGIHWPGGIYFSGGAFAKNRVVWKSDAYTTALVIEALAKVQRKGIL